MFLRKAKNPIVINGNIKELSSDKKEFFVRTNLELFKTNAQNIEAIHFKSKLSENNSEVVKQVTEYLDL